MNDEAVKEERSEIDKGPTEELRDLAKPENEKLAPGGEVPGAQNPDNDDIKNEKNLNTE